MDKVRSFLKQQFARSGKTYAEASRFAGKNHAYIQQFIERGSPRVLPEDVRAKLAAFLDVEEYDLGKPQFQPGMGETPGPVTTGGFSESDIEPFAPPPGHNLGFEVENPTHDVWRINTRDLALAGLLVGDVIVVDISAGAARRAKTGDIVIIQIYDDRSLVEARTLVRQFIEPHWLITNPAAGAPEILNMSQADIHIKGLMISNHRERG
jgi:hypothetical protein